jgi:hypothetical protein
MKTSTSSISSLLLVLLIAGTVLCQTPIKARTESGKEVVLLPDGTWKYAEAAAPAGSGPIVTNKPAGATTLYKSPRAGFGIWYDDSKWFMKKEPDEQGRIEFKLKRGDAYALVLIEEISIPLGTLKEAALENAKSAAPDAKMIFEEYRTVNKTEVLCMKIDGTVKGIPFRYYGYYYGGKQGSIQLLTFTGQDFFSKYEQDLTEFLNGLEIF